MALAAPLSISKPWVRYLLPNLPAAGYMTVLNAGSTDVLITGATSPACGSLMLHQSQDASGMAMMMQMSTLTVPAHGSLILTPGGYHLMCMNPVMKLGQHVTLTLQLQGGATVSANAQVYGATAQP